MIKHDLKCAKTLSIVIKDAQLNVYQKQCQLNPPCRDSSIYTKIALKMFYDNFAHLLGVRLLGITASDWCDECAQVSMFEPPKKKKDIDNVMLKIRDKYGASAIKKGNTMLDDKIAQAFVHEHMDKSD